MIKVAIKGLLGRKLRTTLTALAVVLGVAMVSGAYVLTDTQLGAADKLEVAAYDDVDAVVTSRTAFEVDAHMISGDTPPVPAALLDRVRAVPGVAIATGEINDEALLVGPRGKSLGGGDEDTPTFAIGLDTQNAEAVRLSPFRLVSGRFPRTRGEVTLDAATLKANRLALGDEVGASARGPVRRFKVVGTATFGSLESIGDATAAIFGLGDAQTLFKKPGRLDSILVNARDGVPPGELRAAISRVLPASAQVESAQANDRFEIGNLKEGIGIFRTVLVAFGFIAIFVGGFVIFNTLSITIAQRSREFAMLRTVGASRRQVLASVVVEAMSTGLVASVVGLGAGLGLAAGLTAIFKASGIDLPDSDTVIATRTVVVSLLLGVGVTTFAGLVPAVRATRVDPVTTLREGATSGTRRWRLVLPVAGLVTLVAAGALAYGMFADGVSATDRLTAIGIGCLMLFVGVALLSSRIARPLASVLGRPAERLGRAAGRLARQNSMRNPGRTAATAAALMIGIALVTFVAVFAQGIRSSYGDSFDEQVTADYMVTSQDGWSPLVPEVAESVRSAPGVTAISTVREDQVQVSGRALPIAGVDPATFGQMYRFDWHAGSAESLERLGLDGAIVTKRFAEDHELALGDRIEALAPSGTRLHLAVRGIDARPRFNPLSLPDLTVSRALFDRTFDTQEERFVFAKVRGGESAAVTSDLTRALTGFPDAKARTSGQVRADELRSVDEFLAVLYVLLALSVIVSLFGILNTLALAIIERTRELGTLRAVGMTRRQVRRMVRHESIIVALIGTVIGIGVGLCLGALVAQALSSEGLAFAIPFGSLVTFLVVAVLAGMLAAILPARRAAKLNVLEALQYE